MRTPTSENAIYLVAPSLLECPQCAKHTIVKEEGKYQCINCKFQRTFGAPDQTETGIFGKLTAAFLTFVVVVVILL
ncbi:MAG: hypothetical protein HC886_04125 [Leptolyngbyaceae cyanobacterium SM1_1_3]|nr:hypothetical protein [Leptolyngbyaceae cyanobacterium SM1_1_3]NJN03010.1 hypothetical protein [Leptolyngbyaceae cyanobacterium RM1_1_2]NJO08365.1 hypothetical protein [Leptolyngbyaceae cyanobacterium SL_1_1]